MKTFTTATLLILTTLLTVKIITINREIIRTEREIRNREIVLKLLRQNKKVCEFEKMYCYSK